jgi:hypothetical protein
VADYYSERLERFVEVLRSRQSEAEGGWGARLDLDNAPLSIVTTVQALRALRAVRTRYDDDAVQRGLAYVAEKVQRHPYEKSAEHPEGRGRYPHYVTFGLLGLTTWDEARHDESLVDAQRFCVRWLAKSERDHGGWIAEVRARDTAISLTATSPAVRALERVCSRTDVAEVARRLAAHARREIARTAQGTHERWWAQHPDFQDESPTATALAVLALITGDEPQRELARAGASWLVANHKGWATQVEADDRFDHRQWTHMTFALGLRAIVGPAGGVAPGDKRLRGALEHMHDLWQEDHGAWSNGRPGRWPTTSGSQAVISATETLRRAWQFDPLDDLRSRRRRPRAMRRASGGPLGWRMTLDGGTITLIDERAQPRCEVDFGDSPTQRGMLEVLFARHREGAKRSEAGALTVPEVELARRFNHGRDDSVRRTMHRINGAVVQAHRGTLPIRAIVEERELPGEPGVTRWGLCVDVASEDAPDTSAPPSTR